MAKPQLVTTTHTVMRDLQASLRAQGYAGETVGSFLDALFAQGVQLSDPLASIEYGIAQGRSGQLVIERNEAGAWEIREGTR